MEFSLDGRTCALSVGEFAGFTLGPRDAGGHRPPQRGAAANRFQVQPEAQAGGDFVGVFRQNGDSSTADVAEAHDANIDVSHKAS